MGDVLVVTPLLKGLKEGFPKSKVSVGVGSWAKPLLENNRYIDEIIPCNAPWHNKQICRFPANSPMTFAEGLLYILCSKESRIIKTKRFTHGIDVLGSRQGSWLMKRANIYKRYGVKGYAGGNNWCQQNVIFNEKRNIAESALAFLKLMNLEIDIDPRPIIHLCKNEIEEAEKCWGEKKNKKRLIIAPGGGFPEKCWGDDNFIHLTNLLLNKEIFEICIIGSEEDKSRIFPKSTLKLKNLCGRLNLRQSAAMVSHADFVICNTSLSMHLAGAFKIPALTLLGEWYDSAELHQKQWGYPESTIKGKETKASINHTCTPFDAFELILHSIQKTNP